MGDDAGLPKMVKQWLHVHFCKQWSWAMISILGNAKHCLEHCKHLLNFRRSIALSNAQRCLKHQHFH